MMEVIFAWYRFCFWFSIGQDAGFEVDFAIPSFCGMTAIAVFSLEKFSAQKATVLGSKWQVFTALQMITDFDFAHPCDGLSQALKTSTYKKHSSVLWGFPRASGSSLLRSRALTKDGRFRFGKDPLHMGLGAKSRRYQIPFTSWSLAWKSKLLTQKSEM